MNQQEMKGKNKKRIYCAINDSPGISRAKIAKQCNYSKTTVSLLVDELILDGYVVDGGLLCTSTESRQGRKPSRLYVNNEKYRIVLINWNKRNIQFAQTDLSYQVHDLHTIVVDTDVFDFQTFIISHFIEYIKKYCKDKCIISICCVIPAMIDEGSGNIISAVLPNYMTDRFIIHLRENIAGFLRDVPVCFFNDTACLAYGEKTFGHSSVDDDFVYININSGIGAAYILNGKLLGGASGGNSQFGHFSLGKKGKMCVCGGYGCLETRIGEQALMDRIKECDAEESFREFNPVLFRDVGMLGLEGNEAALRVMDVLAEDLGYALGNLITILRVDRIVLGGYACNLGEHFLARVREKVNGVGFQQFVEKTKIEYTLLDEKSLFGGAAKYYMDNYFNFTI